MRIVADEILSTGWEPDVPPGDTLVRAGVLSLADRILHQARAMGRPVVADGRWIAVNLADTGLFSNAALLVAPPADWGWLGPALAAAIPPGRPALLLSPFPTPDLRPVGLILIGHPPFMVRPAGGAAPGGLEGTDVREVVDAAGLADFERTLIEGYPVPDMDPSAVPHLFPLGLLGGASRLYVAYVDGQPVATAAAHVAAGVNHVEFVATRAEHRGRGIGAAVTWAATISDPTLPAVLISSDDGRGVYESLGYLPIIRWTLWLRP